MQKFLLLLFTFFSTSLYAQPNNVDIGAQLFNHLGEHFLAITFSHHPHWHTYWKNPGDAGTPPSVTFLRNGQTIKFKELEWPVPKIMPQSGELIAYGYENKNALFFYLSTQQLQQLKEAPISVQVKWLACRDTCVPEEQNFTIQLNSKGELTSIPTLSHQFSSSTISNLYRSIPSETTKPESLKIYLSASPTDNELLLHYRLDQVSRVILPHPLGVLTPFPHLPFAYKKEKLFRPANKLYGVIPIMWEGEFEDPPIALPKNGICHRPWKLRFLFQDPTTGKISIITQEFKQFQTTGVETEKSYYQTLPSFSRSYQSSYKNAPQTPTRSSTASNSILIILLLAFLGGIILNVMPCVLPIISIKLFGLIKHSSLPRAAILKHNLAYTLGIFVSFMLLAISIHLLKLSGEQVGWGFQLQSPLFVGIMVIVLFVFALNLFGLFEFTTPGGNKLANMQTGQGVVGDFFSGIIATILSTPCSAPFLGTALTFAFTTSISTLYLIFFMIALGLAFPFILTGIFPQTLKFLPRPGNWMNHLKYILGLTLLITTFWLFDILVALTSTLIIIPLSSMLAMIFFMIFIKNKNRYLFWITLVLLLFIPINYYSSFSSTTTTINPTSHSIDGLHWERWTPEKMNQTGHYVFVDFTAKWCLTCKANKLAVIDTNAFKQLITEYNMKLLLADWTKRDPIIGEWLKAHGFAGVPAYFIITPQGELISLGETLSITKIKGHLHH